MEEKNPDLFSLWKKQVDLLIAESCLSDNEQEILMQFGRTLGQHNFEQQQKHIQLTVSHLDRELEEARDNQMRYGKMAKSLGVLCGLFIRSEERRVGKECRYGWGRENERSKEE